MTRRRLSRAVCLGLLLAAAACRPHPVMPVVTTPKYPTYTSPDIPAGLRISADLRELHNTAWLRLQSGDPGGANRDYSAVLKKQPDFYPSVTGLGYVALANRQFKNASADFSSAIAKNDHYLPAWMGQVDAALGLNNDDQAIAAMERVLVIDPKRDAVRSRLALVRFRDLQAQIEAGRRARGAGKFDDSEKALRSALQLSPTSPLIFRELALTESAAGQQDAAETSARKAVDLEPNDVDSQIALSTVLEARGKYHDAAVALAKAVAIDPKPEWRTHLTELRDKAELASLPSDFNDLPKATSVTRAEVAAFVGIKLRSLIEKAPHHVAPVMTDVRTHWAAPWIEPLTQTGVMDVYANHTFQPATIVRRGDLARVASQLIPLAAAAGGHQSDLVRWRAARPKLQDVVATNLFYRSAALAVTAGAMSAANGQFDPTSPATGADLAALVARIDQLAQPSSR